MITALIFLFLADTHQFELQHAGVDWRIKAAADRVRVSHGSHTAQLAASEDIEVRDLDDLALPARLHHGRFERCGVTVAVALEYEAAWLELFDCDQASRFPADGLTLTLRPVAAWAGHWVLRDGGAREAGIVIIATENGYRVRGEASYQVSELAMNFGEFEAVLSPREGMLLYDAKALGDDSNDPACRIEMRLAGAALDVKDSGRCGGRNVSFTGRYLLRE